MHVAFPTALELADIELNPRPLISDDGVTKTWSRRKVESGR